VIQADGTVDLIRNGLADIAPAGRWDNGLGTLDKFDYQFRLDFISGDPLVYDPPFDSAENDNVWLLASASAQFWAIEEDFGTAEAVCTLRIRDKNTLVEIDTASVTIGAQRTS